MRLNHGFKTIFWTTQVTIAWYIGLYSVYFRVYHTKFFRIGYWQQLDIVYIRLAWSSSWYFRLAIGIMSINTTVCETEPQRGKGWKSFKASKPSQIVFDAVFVARVGRALYIVVYLILRHGMFCNIQCQGRALYILNIFSSGAEEFVQSRNKITVMKYFSFFLNVKHYS